MISLLKREANLKRIDVLSINCLAYKITITMESYDHYLMLQ